MDSETGSQILTLFGKNSPDISPFQRDFGDSSTSSSDDSSLSPFQRDFGGGAETTAEDDIPSIPEEAAHGLMHGTLSVPKTIGYTAGDYIAKQLGATPEAQAREQKKRNATEAAYQKRYGDSDVAEAFNIPGQVIAAAPYLAVGGNLLTAGADAVGATPLLEAAGNKVAQQGAIGRLAAKGTGLAATGAAQGAGFNALTGEDPTAGAETGAILNTTFNPLVAGGAKFVGNKVSNLIQPLTESGRTNIANRIVQGYGESPLNINAQEIVPGSKPTMAEATGNAGIAQLQDTLRDNNSKAFFEREQNNAAARNSALEGAAGTPQDIQSATAQRAAEAEQALGNPDKGITSQLFTNAKPVPTDSVNAKIDEILAGKSGGRPAVAQSMKAVRDILNDENGNPITDPETLYHSVRKGIDDIKNGKNPNAPAGKEALAQLKAVQGTLDDAIESGAPGFKKYLSDYSTASAPIDAMKWMQGLNLKDAHGNTTLSGVQNALKNATKLQNTPGINKAKNLSSGQITALQNIRDDLLRKQNLTAGKSYGSPTKQKMEAENKLQNTLTNSNYHIFDNKLLPELGGTAVGAGIGSLFGVPQAGAALGTLAGAAAKKGYADKNALIRDKLQHIMLNPDAYVPPSAQGSGLFKNSFNNLMQYGAVPGENSLINSLNSSQ